MAQIEALAHMARAYYLSMGQSMTLPDGVIVLCRVVPNQWYVAQVAIYSHGWRETIESEASC